MLRDGGYLIWLDLALPGPVKRLLQPRGKKYGLYTLADVRAEMQKCGLLPLFYEKLFAVFLCITIWRCERFLMLLEIKSGSHLENLYKQNP
ncbi:MAG: hypothetical protein ACE5I1_22320 [bacterium]